jgi:hypothetical protein
MQEIYDLFKKASPVMLCVVIMAYFVKTAVEKKIDGVESRITELARTSLDIKKELRSEERSDIVAFRVALTKWEDCLLGGLTEFAGQVPSQATANSFYEEEKKIFLEVKIEAVKASIYLRDEQLEQRLMGSISKIRNLYDPLINRILPQLIDLQVQLIPLEVKMNRYRESGMTNLALAPTQEDLENNRRIQTAMTAHLKDFSDSLLAQYKPIAEELSGMKKDINRYIYRSVDTPAINRN